MNNTLFIFLIGFIGVALVGGVARFWFVRVYEKLKVETDNISWSIFLVAQLLAFAILFHNSMKDIVVMKAIIEDSSTNKLLELTEYTGVFVLVVLITYTALTAIVNVSLKAFIKDTPGIYEAVRSNQIATVIVAAGLLICFSFICGSLLDDFFHQLLPVRGAPKWF